MPLSPKFTNPSPKTGFGALIYNMYIYIYIVKSFHKKSYEILRNNNLKAMKTSRRASGSCQNRGSKSIVGQKGMLQVLRIFQVGHTCDLWQEGASGRSVKGLRRSSETLSLSQLCASWNWNHCINYALRVRTMVGVYDKGLIFLCNLKGVLG